MAFRKRIGSKQHYSTGTIGGKIRQLRELRNLSMKELGQMCGFPDSGGDVRIAQYESCKKVPTADTLQAIAKALGVPVSVFSGIGEIGSTGRLFSILFELEDQCGLHPYYSDGGWCVRFENTGTENLQLMRKWDMAYKELVLKKNNLAAYYIWKAQNLPEQKEEDSKNGFTEEKLAIAKKDLDEFEEFINREFDGKNER